MRNSYLPPNFYFHVRKKQTPLFTIREKFESHTGPTSPEL